MSLYWYLYPCVCTRLLACISIAAIANTQNEQIYSIRKKILWINTNVLGILYGVNGERCRR